MVEGENQIPLASIHVLWHCVIYGNKQMMQYRIKIKHFPPNIYFVWILSVLRTLTVL